MYGGQSAAQRRPPKKFVSERHNICKKTLTGLPLQLSGGTSKVEARLNEWKRHALQKESMCLCQTGREPALCYWPPWPCWAAFLRQGPRLRSARDKRTRHGA